MVTYGDEDFREWAEEMNFNDDDVDLIRRTSRRNQAIFLIVLIACGALSALSQTVPAPYNYILEGIAGLLGLYVYITLPLFLEAGVIAKIIRNGSFDNVKPSIIWTLFYLVMLVTFLTVIPLIIWIIAKRKLWGTGIGRLYKKGLIGNH